MDVRVKTLHMTCIGFSKPVDYNSEACKAFHTLVNERNNLLHGNVELEKLRFNNVYFHGKIPIFNEYRSMWERTIGVEIETVGLNRLFNEVTVVNAFIEYLSSCIRLDVKSAIDLISNKRDLGLNQDNGRVGILFSERLVDMHMIMDDERSSSSK